MPRIEIAFLSALVLLAGCSATSEDVLSTARPSPTPFKDTDPQDFGTRHPGQHAVHGIDVSKWNGAIDWPQVKRSGVSFAFIKATEGGDRIDPSFAANWRGAASAGLPHAPYHFYYFCSTADRQADWFIANVPKASVHLPPVLDAEWNSASPTCKTRPDAATVRQEMQRFLDRIEAHYGKKPIIYTSVDFHRDNLVGHFRDYRFWLRSVAAHPDEIYEARSWAFWQYTSTGLIPGIDGPADINVFAGTEPNWHEWVADASR